MTKTKKKRKLNSKIVSIAFVLFALVAAIDVGKRVYGLVTLNKQKEVAEAQLAAIKDENASLVSTKEKLEDPDYVQTYAKGQYMFTNDGEVVFILPGEE